MAGHASVGWLGRCGTGSAVDSVVGGLSAHPIVLPVSYGATFNPSTMIVEFGASRACSGQVCLN